MRFGFTPLYLEAADVSRAVAILREVMVEELWRAEEYQVRNAVT
jgi:kynureninase